MLPGMAAMFLVGLLEEKSQIAVTGSFATFGAGWGYLYIPSKLSFEVLVWGCWGPKLARKVL